MSNNTERLPGLLSEHPILLYPSLARMFGSSDHAIIFQQLYFLLSITEKVKSKYNEIDGKWWVYNSYLEWHKEHFPWLSTSTIQRCFLRLEQAGIVESMQSVKHKSDRRKWYTINETEYKVLYEKWENADPSYQNDVMVEHIKLRRCNVANCDDGYTETTTETTKEKKTLSPQVHGDGDSDSDNSSKCADESPVTELLPKEQQLTPDMAEVLADTPFMATSIIGNTHAKRLNGMIKDGLIDYNNPQTKMLVPTAKGHVALQAYRTQQYTLEDCMNGGDSTLCGYIDPNGERLQCNDCYGLGICHLARQESTVVDVAAKGCETQQVAEETPAPKAKKLTAHTLMKNALVAAMGYTQDEVTCWGEYDSASKKLRKAQVTPEEIPALYTFSCQLAARGNYKFKSPVQLAKDLPEYRKQQRQLKALDANTEEDAPQPLSALEGIVRGKEL